MLEVVERRLDKQQVGARLDGQETRTGDVDADSRVEVLDGSTNGSLELDDLLALVGRLVVDNDLERELVVVHDALDRLKVDPDVVGVDWGCQGSSSGAAGQQADHTNGVGALLTTTRPPRSRVECYIELHLQILNLRVEQNSSMWSLGTWATSRRRGLPS